MKEDALLSMLRLHTCIVNSIFKSDNKSTAPRGSRWREAYGHFPSMVLRALVDDRPGWGQHIPVYPAAVQGLQDQAV